MRTGPLIRKRPLFTALCKIAGKQYTITGMEEDSAERHAKRLVANGVPLVTLYNSEGDQYECSAVNGVFNKRRL